MRHCRSVSEMFFVWTMEKRLQCFDYNKGLENVANPKCKVSLKRMELQLVIAILMKQVDEVRSAKRLKTYLIMRTVVIKGRLGCLAIGNQNDCLFAKAQSTSCVMNAILSPVQHLFPPTNIMGRGLIALKMRGLRGEGGSQRRWCVFNEGSLIVVGFKIQRSRKKGFPLKLATIVLEML